MRQEKSIEQMAIDFEINQRAMRNKMSGANRRAHKANRKTFAIKKMYKEKKYE